MGDDIVFEGSVALWLYKYLSDSRYRYGHMWLTEVRVHKNIPGANCSATNKANNRHNAHSYVRTGRYTKEGEYQINYREGMHELGWGGEVSVVCTSGILDGDRDTIIPNASFTKIVGLEIEGSLSI
jgi:hypothetical protein